MSVISKIPNLAIGCVLIGTLIPGGAFSASSVRSLGGAGTYTSAASASDRGAVTNSASAARSGVSRAGSVRVGPSSGQAGKPTTSPGTPSGSVGRVSSPRLSIGKYLGGGTAISGGSSARPQVPGGIGGGTGGGSGGDIDMGLVDDLSRTVDELSGKIEELEQGKQDLIESGDNFIVVADNQISLDTESLIRDASDGILGVDAETGEIYLDTNALLTWLQDNGYGDFGRRLQLQVVNEHLQVSYDEGNTWEDLIALSELVPDVDLSQYLTRAQADELYRAKDIAIETVDIADAAVVGSKIAGPDNPGNDDYALVYIDGQVQWAPVVVEYNPDDLLD